MEGVTRSKLLRLTGSSYKQGLGLQHSKRSADL